MSASHSSCPDVLPGPVTTGLKTLSGYSTPKIRTRILTKRTRFAALPEGVSPGQMSRVAFYPHSIIQDQRCCHPQVTYKEIEFQRGCVPGPRVGGAKAWTQQHGPGGPVRLDPLGSPLAPLECSVTCRILCHAFPCDPMDCSPPGSFVHGIFQARILELVAISFSWKLNLGLLHCRWIPALNADSLPTDL